MKDYVLRQPAEAPRANVPGPRADPRRHPFACVRPIVGEPGRFLVQSRSRSDVEHLVDLLEGTFGVCSCENFTFAREKHVREGRPISTAVFCWHLKMTLAFIGWEVREQLKANLARKGFTHERKPGSA